MKKLDAVTNVTFLVVALLIGAALIQKQFTRPIIPPKPELVKVGDAVDIPNIDWSSNRSTLVLAIHSKCSFCVDSAPFYRRLLATANAPSRVSVVMPEPVVEGSAGRDFLKNLTSQPQNAHQVDFRRAKIRGTPTILLVDRDGRVRRIWSGKLSEDGERDVLAALSESD